MNENYAMPEMPKGAEEGILKGMYKFISSDKRIQNFAHNYLAAVQF